LKLNIIRKVKIVLKKFKVEAILHLKFEKVIEAEEIIEAEEKFRSFILPNLILKANNDIGGLLDPNSWDITISD